MFLFFSCKKASKEKITDQEPIASGLKKEVFGFHPHWMKDSFKNYNFDLLTAISYYSYELDPITGGYKMIHDWKSSAILDSAKAHNVKTYLTVTNLNIKDNQLFLKNKMAQENSIQTIIGLLLEREADGVTINFEDIAKNSKGNLTNYVRNLSNELNKHGKKVVITLPQKDKSHSFDVLKLNRNVEFFIILAQNYYDISSDIAGPVAPLYNGELWTQGSIANSVDYYLNSGIPKEKLILTLPYYGSKWQTENDSIPSKNIEFVKHLTYSSIKNAYLEEPLYDTESASAYFNTLENGKNIQVWFDDDKTLAKKYAFINENELAGVGIWALGYDDGYPELWNLLEDEFITKSTATSTNQE